MLNLQETLSIAYTFQKIESEHYDHKEIHAKLSVFKSGKIRFVVRFYFEHQNLDDNSLKIPYCRKIARKCYIISASIKHLYALSYTSIQIQLVTIRRDNQQSLFRIDILTVIGAFKYVQCIVCTLNKASACPCSNNSKNNSKMFF